MYGLVVVGWGLSRTLPEAVAVALLLGLTASIINVVWDASLQELVAPELLGRVKSTDMAGSMALTPVGVALAGVAADAWGSTPAFILAGIVSLLIALVGLLTPRARRFGKQRFRPLRPTPVAPPAPTR